MPTEKTRISETALIEPTPPVDLGPCAAEHLGPWVVVSRAEAKDSHAQCQTCGTINRDGVEARKIRRRR